MITITEYKKDTFTQRQVFEEDYKLPVKKILQGLHPERYLRESTKYEDTKMATDWVAECKTSTSLISIACRGRDYKPEYSKFIDEFTIRLGYPNVHVVTEFEKIMKGYGDQFLYYWRDKKAAGQIVLFHLLDLNVFRKEAEEVIAFRRMKPQQNRKSKGGETFYPFKIAHFSKELVIAKYDMAEPPY